MFNNEKFNYVASEESAKRDLKIVDNKIEQERFGNLVDITSCGELWFPVDDKSIPVLDIPADTEGSWDKKVTVTITKEDSKLSYFTDDIQHHEVFLEECIRGFGINVTKGTVKVHNKHLLYDHKVSVPDGMTTKQLLEIINEQTRFMYGTGYRVFFTFDYPESHLFFCVFPFYKASALTDLLKE